MSHRRVITEPGTAVAHSAETVTHGRDCDSWQRNQFLETLVQTEFQELSYLGKKVTMAFNPMLTILLSYIK